MDAAEWDERYRSTDRLWSAEPNLFVADRLAHVTPGVGVDLAGGEGRNSIWLAERGWKMVCVDFSQEAIERGRSHGQPGVEFVVADVLEWEPAEEVDLVLIAYLHLVSDQFSDVLGRSRKWLKPGGELFMIGHDVSNLDEGHGGPQYREILWDVTEIVNRVDGLTVIESEVVRRPVTIEDGTAYALDSLVRARQPG